MLDFGTARSTCMRITLRFRDCIRQVRVAIISIEELVDLRACDAIFCHLLNCIAAEIRIAPVRMFLHYVEPFYCKKFSVSTLSAVCPCHVAVG